MMKSLLTIFKPFVQISQLYIHHGVIEVIGSCIWIGASRPIRVKVFVTDQLLGSTRVTELRYDIISRILGKQALLLRGFHIYGLLPTRYTLSSTNNEQVLPLTIVLNDRTGRHISISMSVLSRHANNLKNDLQSAQNLVALIQQRVELAQHPLTVLDWNGIYTFTEMQYNTYIFKPVLDLAAHLPYLDASIDVVIFDSSKDGQRVEATRVARDATIGVDRQLGITTLHTQPVQSSKHVHTVLTMQVSIIIPVFNQVTFTKQCLAYLQATLPTSINLEVIIIDDASTDSTPNILARLAQSDARFRILRNSQNDGFIVSCNRGAEIARAEIIIFLNNDTMPQPNWLPPLTNLLAQRPDAGAVGCKLLNLDGSIQEAGGLIFNDGSGIHVGRGTDRVEHPLFSFVREVDYCSGAALATRRSLFLQLGSFDLRYQPAYYEDTDYCFQLRSHGYKVYYQPASVVIHVEGGSGGIDTTTGVKRYQEINRVKFREKWSTVLQSHLPSPTRVKEYAQYDLVYYQNQKLEIL